MSNTKAPFRYDIVGSFLRPAALMKMREAFANGNATAEELRAAAICSSTTRPGVSSAIRRSVRHTRRAASTSTASSVPMLR